MAMGILFSGKFAKHLLPVDFIRFPFPKRLSPTKPKPLGADVGLRVVVVRGDAAARAHGLDGIEDSEGGEDGPEEEAEGDGCLDGPADRVAATVGAATEGDGQGDRAGEPEDHSDGLEGQRR